MGRRQGGTERSRSWRHLGNGEGVFKGLFAIELLDDREDYGEDRYVIIGMVSNRLLFVAYTMRGEAIRIISARGAEPHERRQYHEANG